MLEHYLKVWDLREGWTGSAYDATAERSFLEISVEVGRPLATVVNQYNSAFTLISGHSYTFENWFRLFKVLKLTGPFGPTCMNRRHVVPRRRHRRGSIRQVTESELSGGKFEHDGGLLAGFAAANEDTGNGDVEIAETIEHIRVLVDAGRDDEAIMKDLGPHDPEAMRAVIGHLRQRFVAEKTHNAPGKKPTVRRG